MQGRLTQNDVSNRVNVEDADLVGSAVVRLFASRYPGADFGKLTSAFEDIKALFSGTYPGYLVCDTLYHDLRHTLDAALATARLIDGHDRTQPESARLGPRRAMLGVIIALLHDSGYLKRKAESQVENGAVFTKVHVSRSADFLLDYLPRLGFAAEALVAARLVHFTGYEIDIDELAVEDPRDHVLGCIVGTADLIAQMADRTYLEKCRDFLYQEFVWGGLARETLLNGREVVNYRSPSDVVLKTPDYYDNVARKRIEGKLGGVERYAEAHFGGANLYRVEIETTMRFLRAAIQNDELDRMRRACYSLSAQPAAQANSQSR
ncbi:MAG: hypothetical protein EPO27_08000 [Betaproteobacteria bacterium]|nr:MAG: hypothetical protein EPO27_08000 [Betaproteobacteria bacterium]